MLAPVAPLHDADLGNDCGDCEVFLASIALEHLLGEAHLGHFELCQSALAWMKRYGCRTAKLLRENGYNCSTYEPAKWSYYTQRKDIVTYARYLVTYYCESQTGPTLCLPVIISGGIQDGSSLAVKS